MSRVRQVSFKLYLLLVSIIIFSMLFGRALAYDLKSHTWPSDPTMRVATISFPSGSVWRDDLERGVGRWSGLWGMWLEFDLNYSNYSSFNSPCDGTSGDEENNVVFVSSADVDGGWGLHCSDRDGSERPGFQHEYRRASAGPDRKRVHP